MIRHHKMICDVCNSTEVEHCNDQVLCAQCGKVLEEETFVNVVQFLENTRGGSSVCGKVVGADGRLNFGANLGLGYGRESRQVTLNNAKQRLQRLALQLNIGDFFVERALKYFNMALNKGLTKGRKAEYIAAACLYTACRTADRAPLPYMLLDFSDALRADVYALGHVYLRLCKELCILQPSMQVHSPDPAIYIERYAHKLEFGEKTMDVCKTATRLVSRMKRDWLAQGRRPSGICGAALLVAARIFDFNRTIKDIMKVVRIGEGTIKKRLVEFEQTPSSSLTIDEFLYQKIDLAEEMDPPSFTEGKRKAKLLELEEKGELPHLMEEVERLQAELEAAIDENLQKKHRKYRKYMTGDSMSLCSTAPSLSDLDEELAQYGALLEDDTTKSIIEEECDVHSKNVSTKSEKREKDEFEKGTNDEDRDPEVEDMVEKELNGVLLLTDTLGPRPTAASLGIKETIEDCLKSPDGEAGTEEDDGNKGELDLTDINDEELDMLILNEDEVKIKTTIWMRENADFLREMKEKEERKAKELLENPQPKKKRKVKKRPVKTEARSAREAMEKMLHEKKISSKINYDVLMNLNLGSAGKPVEPPPPPPTMETPTKVEETVAVKRSKAEPDIYAVQAPPKKLKDEKPGENRFTMNPATAEAEEADYDEGDEDEYENEDEHANHVIDFKESFGNYSDYDDD